MPEFTGGKWEHDARTGEIRSGNFTVCKVHGATVYNSEPNAGECAANARLIASAPEIYDWLTFLDCAHYEEDINFLMENVHALVAYIDGREAES